MRRKRSPKKRLIRFGIFLLVVAIVGWIGLDHIAPMGVVGKQGRTDTITPAKYGLNFERMQIPTRDSIELAAFYIPSALDTSYGTFMVLHGVGACKEYMLHVGNKLAHEGINVLIYDSRAHGRSGGEYLSYGFREKYDAIDALDFLIKNRPASKYGIWGVSYGGAVSLQTLAIEPRLELAVIESSFSTFRETVFDYKKRITKIGWHWVADRVLYRCGQIADFNPDSIQPEQSCKHITQSIVLAHGDADIHIDLKYGKRNFANLASADKEFVLLEGGAHNDMWTVGGDEYVEKLLRFIRVRWAGMAQ